jgi:hypothetical protein
MGEQLGVSPVKPIAANATYISFTKVVGFKIPPGPSHTYFLGSTLAGSENIRKFHTNIFHGNEVKLNDKSMFRLRDDGLGYDILVR